ncbi:MAG: PAS domain S-box protein [Calditrichae bacterium]|nr:PAS domain S-box protein [Calditrichia bacterium]
MQDTPLDLLWPLAIGTLAMVGLIVLFMVGAVLGNRRLRRQHRLVSTILEGSPALILAVNRAGQVVEFNRACETVTGYRAGEIRGKAITTCRSGRRCPRYGARIAAADLPRCPGSAATSPPKTAPAASSTGSSPNCRARTGRCGLQIGSGLEMTAQKIAEEKMLAYQAQLGRLSSQMTRAEEKERRNIAGELHDGISQTLAAVSLELSLIWKRAAGSDLQPPLGAVQELIRDVIRATRTLMYELIPRILYERGFLAAIEWLCERMSARYGLPIQCRDDGAPKPLSENMAIFLFKAVRELLINVGKHAGAGRAEVDLRRVGDEIVITVSDDGCGFDPGKPLDPDNLEGGFGLYSIRERLDYHGANMTVDSAPGHGARIASPPH